MLIAQRVIVKFTYSVGREQSASGGGGHTSDQGSTCSKQKNQLVSLHTFDTVTVIGQNQFHFGGEAGGEAGQIGGSFPPPPFTPLDETLCWSFCLSITSTPAPGNSKRFRLLSQ